MSGRGYGRGGGRGGLPPHIMAKYEEKVYQERKVAQHKELMAGLEYVEEYEFMKPKVVTESALLDSHRRTQKKANEIEVTPVHFDVQFSTKSSKQDFLDTKKIQAKTMEKLDKKQLAMDTFMKSNVDGKNKFINEVDMIPIETGVDSLSQAETKKKCKEEKSKYTKGVLDVTDMSVSHESVSSNEETLNSPTHKSKYLKRVLGVANLSVKLESVSSNEETLISPTTNMSKEVISDCNSNKISKGSKKKRITKLSGKNISKCKSQPQPVLLPTSDLLKIKGELKNNAATSDVDVEKEKAFETRSPYSLRSKAKKSASSQKVRGKKKKKSKPSPNHETDLPVISSNDGSVILNPRTADKTISGLTKSTLKQLAINWARYKGIKNPSKIYGTMKKVSLVYEIKKIRKSLIKKWGKIYEMSKDFKNQKHHTINSNTSDSEIETFSLESLHQIITWWNARSHVNDEEILVSKSMKKNDLVKKVKMIRKCIGSQNSSGLFPSNVVMNSSNANGGKLEVLELNNDDKTGCELSTGENYDTSDEEIKHLTDEEERLSQDWVRTITEREKYKIDMLGIELDSLQKTEDRVIWSGKTLVGWRLCKLARSFENLNADHVSINKMTEKELFAYAYWYQDNQSEHYKTFEELNSIEKDDILEIVGNLARERKKINDIRSKMLNSEEKGRLPEDMDWEEKLNANDDEWVNEVDDYEEELPKSIKWDTVSVGDHYGDDDDDVSMEMKCEKTDSEEQDSNRSGICNTEVNPINIFDTTTQCGAKVQDNCIDNPNEISKHHTQNGQSKNNVNEDSANGNSKENTKTSIVTPSKQHLEHDMKNPYKKHKSVSKSNSICTPFVKASTIVKQSLSPKNYDVKMSETSGIRATLKERATRNEGINVNMMSTVSSKKYQKQQTVDFTRPVPFSQNGDETDSIQEVTPIQKMNELTARLLIEVDAASVNIPMVGRQIFRLFKEADKTCRLLPFFGHENDDVEAIDQEEMIPNEETKVKQWIDNPRIVHAAKKNKLAFNMRIATLQKISHIKDTLFPWMSENNGMLKIDTLKCKEVYCIGCIVNVHTTFVNRYRLKRFVKSQLEKNNYKGEINLFARNVWSNHKGNKVVSRAIVIEVNKVDKDFALDSMLDVNLSTHYKSAHFLPFNRLQFSDELINRVLLENNIYHNKIKRKKIDGLCDIDNPKMTNGGNELSIQKWMSEMRSNENGEKLFESVETSVFGETVIMYEEKMSQKVTENINGLQESIKKVFGNDPTVSGVRLVLPLNSYETTKRRSYAEALAEKYANPQEPVEFSQVTPNIRPNKNKLYYGSAPDKTPKSYLNHFEKSKNNAEKVSKRLDSNSGLNANLLKKLDEIQRKQNMMEQSLDDKISKLIVTKMETNNTLPNESVEEKLRLMEEKMSMKIKKLKDENKNEIEKAFSAFDTQMNQVMEEQKGLQDRLHESMKEQLRRQQDMNDKLLLDLNASIIGTVQQTLRNVLTPPNKVPTSQTPERDEQDDSGEMQE